MQQYDKVELAWAAGFFDGEGWAGIRTKYPALTVGQKYPEPLQRMRRALGGLGTICGPYRYHGDTCEMWYYYLNKFEHVQQAIACLWQFVMPRTQVRFAFILNQKRERAK